MEHLALIYDLYLKHPKIATDSRKISSNCIFWALRGERFDGNAFAAEALEKGAALAIVDRPEYATNERFILVEDSLKTLQELARHHRRQFHIPVIAITGSNGKTTTKELTAAVMGAHYRTWFTPGNYNNHIGVPLTLLSMPRATEVAIIEMGANAQGEIDCLSRIAKPTHGLITNIGKAHLEGFGGVEGIKKGKSELYRFLAQTDGTAFVNKDEPFLEELSLPVQKRVFYLLSDQPDPWRNPYELVLEEEQPFLKVRFLGRDRARVEIQTQLSGRYNLGNLSTAIALGRYFKVPDDRIRSAIEHFIPSDNRSQLQDWRGGRLILDAYNANPTSMGHALKHLAIQPATARIAILGDMFELGKDALVEHRAIHQLALELPIDQLILVGTHFSEAVQADSKTWVFPTLGAARPFIEQLDFQDKVILLKGSRGMAMEQLVEL